MGITLYRIYAVAIFIGITYLLIRSELAPPGSLAPAVVGGVVTLLLLTAQKGLLLRWRQSRKD